MTYRVRVVRINDYPTAYYIGRPSVMENPWPIGEGASRIQVIRQYDVYFHEKVVNSDLGFLQELLKIHKQGKKNGIVRLGCYCRPLYHCHGDIIKHFLLTSFDLLEELESQIGYVSDKV